MMVASLAAAKVRSTRRNREHNTGDVRAARPRGQRCRRVPARLRDGGHGRPSAGHRHAHGAVQHQRPRAGERLGSGQRGACAPADPRGTRRSRAGPPRQVSAVRQVEAEATRERHRLPGGTRTGVHRPAAARLVRLSRCARRLRPRGIRGSLRRGRPAYRRRAGLGGLPAADARPHQCWRGELRQGLLSRSGGGGTGRASRRSEAQAAQLPIRGGGAAARGGRTAARAQGRHGRGRGGR